MKKFLLPLAVVVAFSAQAQIDIAAARTQPTGATVTVRGVVTNGSEFGNSIRYIQDPTAGIGLFNTSGLVGSLQRGDSVEATGAIAPYMNLMEIAVTSVTVISSGNALPAPQVVTAATAFAEAYEGELVRINATEFTTAGTFAGNQNYDIEDATGDGEVRINAASNIVGTPIPGGDVDIVGIMSQFNATYQLLPRDLADFITAGNPPVFTTSLQQSNIAQNSFTVSFNTLNNGNTIVIYGTNPSSLTQVAADNAQTTNHVMSLTSLQAGTIYYVQGISISGTNDTSFSSIQAMATASASTGVITVYFNRPVDHTVSTGTNAVFLNQALDDTLKAYIGRAQETLDIAIYNVDNQNGIIDAINARAAAGVQVRVVCDNGVSATNYGAFIPAVQKIMSPSGSTYGIMHNKMVIADANSANPNRPILWTGSANFTDEQINLDAQNVIIFQDQSMAKAATLEFNEMFGNGTSGTFGPDKSDNTPHEFLVNGKRVRMFFSPSDAVNAQIDYELTNADQSIQFALFAFTRTELAYAMSDAYASGANIVQGVVDDTAQSTAVYNILTGAAGAANIKIFPLPYLMHNKYALVDVFDVNSDPMVLTGSYNYSNAATIRNDENVVIVHDATIANIYFQEWSQRFKDSGGSVVVGVNPMSAQKAMVTLYPNPASEYFELNIAFPQNDLPAFNLVDATGRVIKSWNANVSTGRQAMDIRELPAGFYLLQVQSNTLNETLRMVKH
ncbi:MAG TPA: phospholipase D-like domain-containing protein [Chitinophagales bacterium]|nr:phospholipase D-like domain-containing protein [Chitinophagales bacterium]